MPEDEHDRGLFTLEQFLVLFTLASLAAVGFVGVLWFVFFVKSWF